jgi:hypothetical protein
MTLTEAGGSRPSDQIKECPMSRISGSAAFKKDSVKSRRSIGLAGLFVLGALLPVAALAASGSSGLAGSAPENGTVAVTGGSMRNPGNVWVPSASRPPSPFPGYGQGGYGTWSGERHDDSPQLEKSVNK